MVFLGTVGNASSAVKCQGDNPFMIKKIIGKNEAITIRIAFCFTFLFFSLNGYSVAIKTFTLRVNLLPAASVTVNSKDPKPC